MHVARRLDKWHRGGCIVEEDSLSGRRASGETIAKAGLEPKEQSNRRAVEKKQKERKSTSATTTVEKETKVTKQLSTPAKN